MVVVKINPADVVSVPSDCACQKVRVCKYEVVSDFVEEIQASVVDEGGNDTVVTDDAKVRNENIDKIVKYLNNKYEDGYPEVTTRQIQNSFSPGWITKLEVLDAIQSINGYWEERDGVTYVSTL
jgi:hypothetical protein